MQSHADNKMIFLFQLSFQIWTNALLLIFNNLVLTEATWGSNYGQNSNNLVILSIDTALWKHS